MELSKPSRQMAMVVEDDPLQRGMIVLLLEESGFDVIECEDAETALLEIRNRRPVFLITDVNLTGRMDGVELAHLAHDQDAAMRIIVISGKALASALPNGATFYSKPVSPTILLRAAAH